VPNSIKECIKLNHHFPSNTITMNIELFKSLTKTARNIFITTHQHPDADGIGSQMALKIALEQLGKKVLCINQHPTSAKYKHLDKKSHILSYKQFIKLDFKETVDLFIVTDTNSLSRIGTGIEELVKNAKNLLFIDHHPAPVELRSLHCIDVTASATGEIVGQLIDALGVELNQNIAFLLYTAILIDTNSFRYPSVTGKTHRLIAKLIDSGMKPSNAYNRIYCNKKISDMHLLGNILSLAKINSNETIAWLTLDEKTLKKFNVDPEDTHHFINNLLVLDNLKIACLFRQTGDHVKISLRSTGNIDVSTIAEALGGGGHHHAAAINMLGNIEDVTQNVLQKLEIILQNQSAQESTNK